MILPDPSSIQHCSTTCLIMFKGALVCPSVMDDLLAILFSFSPLGYRLQLLIPHQLAHIPRTRLTWLLALGNPEHSKGNGQHQRQHHGQGQGEVQEQCGTVVLPGRNYSCLLTLGKPTKLGKGMGKPSSILIII